MSDTTLGDVTNSLDLQNNRQKVSNSLLEKGENVKQSSSTNIKNMLKAVLQDDKLDLKENTQVHSESGSNSTKSSSKSRLIESLFDQKDRESDQDSSEVLPERRDQEADDHEDIDSPDENEEEDQNEKENAMNRLKALLGSSKSKQKKQPSSSQIKDHKAALRKSLSQNDDSNIDFLRVIDRMQRDLFDKLDITEPKNSEDNYDNVSKIFYDGREGQEYTITVLQKFFHKLKYNATQFVQKYESYQNDQKHTKAKNKEQDDEQKAPSTEDDESDKEKIRKKLLGGSKHTSKQVSNSNIEGLKSLLLNTKNPKKSEPQDIKDIIKTDIEVLNYGTVNPGKLLGSIIMITNTSDEEQTIDLSIDGQNKIYDRDEIIKRPEFEYLEELSNQEIELTDKETEGLNTEEAKVKALEQKKRYIPNSEVKHDCWFIENPKTKDLVKNITLKLGPKCEQDFIIVLKTLQPKFKSVALSFLNLQLPDQKSDTYKEKQIQKTQGDSVSVSETKTKSNILQVML